MNRKQLLILLVFGIVIGGLGYWAYKQKQNPYEESTRKMGEKLMPDFPLNDVAQLTLKTRDAQLNLAKKDEVWNVKERGEYPANFSNLRDLLIKISELKITKPIQQVLPARLELLPPDKCASTQVEFKDAKGKVLKSMLLGAKHNKDAPANSPYGGGSFPDGRYVMVGNDISLISDALSNTDPKPEEWLNKDWFKVEKLRSISITSTNATNNWKLSRESETNEWKLADLKAGEQLDSGKLTSVTSALSSPSFNDVATNAPEQMKTPLMARLETTEGFAYDVKVANRSGEDYFLQMAISGSFAKERSPGKDEKPEDKAKLDKEFSDKKAKFEEKLKTEKAFEKWTYVVSKWSIEPLLKERKDLLQEKKEEPKKEDAKPAAAIPTLEPPKPPAPPAPPTPPTPPTPPAEKK